MNGSTDVGVRMLARSVLTTSACNIIGVAAAGVAGIIVARALGPTIRGEYAAIFVWFGFALLIGELGQTAATTYFVAHDPDRAPDYLASSRNLMVLTGFGALVAGMLITPLLAAGTPGLAWGYRLIFATSMVWFVGASYTFSLQAVHTPHWNLVRLVQPVGYVMAIGTLLLTRHLGLMTVLAGSAGAMVAQALFAYLFCRRHHLTGGRFDPYLRRRLSRYGFGQVASTVPTAVTQRLDQLVLSLAAAPAVLGHYAVAASVTGLAVPVVAAVGYVALPRLASRTLSDVGEAQVQRWALLFTMVTGVALLLPLALLAPWVIPLVFGAGYSDAVILVMLLTPAGLFLACGQVCGDLLRGYGKPYAVARAQVVGAVVTVLMLTALVPLWGSLGAAVTVSIARGVSLVLMLRFLVRPRGRHTGTPSGVSQSVSGRHRR